MNDNGNANQYKASGNLNTAIGNPNVNINDTMNVNIQNMASDINGANMQNVSNLSDIPGYNNINANMNSMSINQVSNDNNVNNNNIGVVSSTNDEQDVNKVYVANNNQPKKKTISVDMGPEFKLALLIVVILLIFVFVLPMISDFIRD